ncbi:MAG: N-acetyltransferase family protein [Haloarculaceae archaeon]
MTPRSYPDEVAGPHDPPPRAFTDREGRAVTIRALDAGPPGGSASREATAPDDRPEESAPPSDADPPAGALEALVAMYLAFDPDDRAQGIPPTGEDAIRDWLDSITGEGSINVVAWHDGDAVGHATLVPDGRGAYELAIFVLSDYQEAGIGTALIEALLGLGRERGVDRVWLTVERWNEPAKQLYRKVGFRSTGRDSFEVEMSARLRRADDESGDGNGDADAGR